MSDPLEEHGPGWTTGPSRPTNEYFGQLVRETYRAQAPLILPRGEDDG